MALDNIKKFFGVETEDAPQVETGAEDVYYKVAKAEVQEESPSSNKMILFEPRAYSESSQIVDYLKSRNTVVVNLKRVTPDQAKRIIDFLTGSLYAMNGSLQKLGGGIFLCAPNNVNIEGKITEEAKPASASKGKSKEEKEDEFNW
ncbi:MAG: cell division protein SepF [Bacilli bacterium]|nr:cell division protein SepF [Bacilli bacterium]